MNKRLTFLEIATAAINRGFAISPVLADKHGVFWGQFSHPIRNLTEATQCSKDFPNHNVGIVSRHGLGNLCFLDFDAQGVVEQIETETGRKMPDTLRVKSQPVGKPWKQHYYFRQTAYSCATFKRETTGIADLTKFVDGKHPNRYDLKGVGRGGYVVGAGSTRDNGEVYTYIENPILPIPDWLVDWIRDDVHKYRSEGAKLREAEKRKHAGAMDAKASHTTPPKYSPQEINIALWSRAMSFAQLGARRPDIERLLRAQMEDFMHDGKALAAEWKDHIHKVAYDKTLRIGSLKKEFLPKTLKRPITIKTRPPVSKPGEIMIDSTIRQRYTTIKAEIENLQDTMKFKDVITSKELYARLKIIVEKAGFTINSDDNADQQSVGRQMRKAGFKAKNIGGVQRWSKTSIEQRQKPMDKNERL